jgi:hypothetical protein
VDNSLFIPKLAKDGRPFRYSTLTGIEDARIVGSSVFGHFQSSLCERLAEPTNRLVASFVNWPTNPKDVLRFTMQNGPLDDTATSGAEFTIAIDRFIEVQEELRQLWRNPLDPPEWNVKAGKIRFSGGSIIYVAKDLRTFLHFDLMTAPADRLKVCARVGCQHPYFLAGDLKRRFCSVECREDNRRAAKRNIWKQKTSRSEKNVENV